MQKTKNNKPKQVSKPFLRGAAWDKTCIKSVLALFGGTLGMMVGFFIVGGMMMWDNMFLRCISNLMLLGCAYMLFYYSGTSRGTAAVNHGEIMYQRRETGREVSEAEQKLAYHPAKGFFIGLLGCVPLVICGAVYAVIAKPVMISMGALPSWVATINRTDITDALVAYQQTVPMELEDVLRVMMRMCLMPLVNIVGAENTAGLLTMDRLSGLLMLLPGISYGIGYLQGVQIRMNVHTNIAEGKRKQAKKARKAQRSRQRGGSGHGPQQLN